MKSDSRTSHVNFEDALKKLEEIVALLEKGDTSLEEALKLYEEGQALIKSCRDILTKTETRVKELIKTSEGKFQLKEYEM